MKKIKAKPIIALVLALILTVSAFTVMPMSASAADKKQSPTADATYHVSTGQELYDASTAINSNNSGTYNVYIDADFESSYGFGITKSVTVNIYGEGHTLTFTQRECCIDACEGATINLGSATYDKTLVISGKQDVSYNDCAGAIHVWGTATTCNMYDGVTVKDRKGNNYLGGGVTVESGTFNMYGGTIENCGIEDGTYCYGGGVAVYNGGTFIMNDGLIKDCYVTNTYSKGWQTPATAGGGVYVWRSTFEMNGGEICNCSASGNDAIGGGIAVVTSDEAYYENGGYGYLDSKFTMDGGKVDKCTASVVGGGLAAGMGYNNLSSCCTDMNILSGPSNPGVFINSGEMSDNGASQGGAVFLNWIRGSRPVQIKNTTFKNNEAATGGAISVLSYWTQTQIEGCTFTGNTAESNGAAISLLKNSSGSGTHIKDTTITGNTITDTDNDLSNRGAGVYYDANSKLTISGANIIQNNKYNNKENNLNIFNSSKPVYVDGDLTGSQIGLSDPTLWDDGKEDTAEDAVSTESLTSGFKTNNDELLPAYAFTSDHTSWYVDYSNVNTNEVRLVRSNYEVNYHINNADMDDSIYDSEIFTPYVTNNTVEPGNTIQEFHNIPKLKDPDGYIFKGWYYADGTPVKFGEDTYETGDKYIKYKDIYAQWEPVEEIEKDPEDDKILPASMNNKYRKFGLFGVQIRPRYYSDKNYDETEKKDLPGGLRFITSLSNSMLNEIGSLYDTKVVSDQGKEHDVEYGYVVAPKKIVQAYVKHYNASSDDYKLQYKGTDVNGVNTTVEGSADTDFNYIKNVDCTSRADLVDHKSFSGYRLSSMVITYEGESASYKDQDICARAYLRYYDANGLLRTFYNDYDGTTTYGGCCISYNEAEENFASNTNTYYKKGA